MSKRIFSILLVTLSATLFLTACKDGEKTTGVTMEELRNTDLSRMIIPDSILTNPDYCSQKDEFMFIEKTSEFEPIGYRGRDFQRFYIHYDSVRFMGNGVYKVEGRTRYRDTIRLFSGTITLDSMRLNKGKHLPSTGKFGKLCGHFQFDEDEFSGGGVLTGKMWIGFAKINGRFYYDAFKLGLADGYSNRQYEGVLRKTSPVWRSAIGAISGYPIHKDWTLALASSVPQMSIRIKVGKFILAVGPRMILYRLYIRLICNGLPTRKTMSFPIPDGCSGI